MGGIVVEEDLLTKYKVIDPKSEKGQEIQDFLEKRARLLVGDQIDFVDTPVLFLLSDTDEPNAFFMPPSNPSDITRNYDDYRRQETDPQKREKLDHNYKISEGVFSKEKEQG